MRYLKASLAVCAISMGAMFASGASAQEVGASPTFADVSLSAGFMPDPHRVAIVAGGTIDAASSRGGRCVGKIASAPDVRLTYGAGSNLLKIKVTSNEDTTLVVNGADGTWYCDDDSGGGTNPMFLKRNPDAGVYEIWVGTYGDTPVDAVIEITEVD